MLLIVTIVTELYVTKESGHQYLLFRRMCQFQWLPSDKVLCNLSSKSTNAPPGSDHIFHLTIADVWSCEPDLQTFLVEAIVA